jgi:hypothetical protein
MMTYLNHALAFYFSPCTNTQDLGSAAVKKNFGSILFWTRLCRVALHTVLVLTVWTI